MANTQQNDLRPNDLRNGESRVEPSSNAKLPGHSEGVMPTPKSGEHAVNPGAGSKAGVAEGQGTKSS